MTIILKVNQIIRPLCNKIRYNTLLSPTNSLEHDHSRTVYDSYLVWIFKRSFNSTTQINASFQSNNLDKEKILKEWEENVDLSKLSDDHKIIHNAHLQAVKVSL